MAVGLSLKPANQTCLIRDQRNVNFTFPFTKTNSSQEITDPEKEMEYETSPAPKFCHEVKLAMFGVRICVDRIKITQKYLCLCFNLTLSSEASGDFELTCNPIVIKDKIALD